MQIRSKKIFIAVFRITALVIIQAVLLLECGWCGNCKFTLDSGREIKRDTLAPQLLIHSGYFQNTFNVERYVLYRIIDVFAPQEDVEDKADIDVYGIRYEGRKWLFDLINSIEGDKLIDLIEQAHENGVLTKEETEVFLYAVKNKAASPEELDKPLAKYWNKQGKEVTPARIMKLFHSKKYITHMKEGCYEILSAYLMTDINESSIRFREKLKTELRDIIKRNIVGFARLSRSRDINIENFVDKVLLQWPADTEILRDRKESVKLLMEYPSLTNKAAAGRLGIHENTLKKRLKTINKRFIETADRLDDYDDFIERLLEDNESQALNKVCEEKKKILAGWETIVKEIIENIGVKKIKSRTYSAEFTDKQIPELIILKIVENMTDKALALKFGVSEGCIQRFFGGRKEEYRQTPGAIKKLKAYVGKTLYRFEARVKNLKNNYEELTPGQSRRRRAELFSSCWRLYPRLKGNYLAAYKEIARILETPSLSVFIERTQNIRKIGGAFSLFFSEKRKEFKAEVMAELADICKRFPHLARASKEEMKGIIQSESKYAKAYGGGLYADLFPELSEQAVIFSKDLKKFYAKIKDLSLNPGMHSESATRNALAETVEIFWRLHPHLKGDYFAAYKEIAEISEAPSLSVFVGKSRNPREIRKIFRLFFSEEKEEFKKNVKNELLTIYADFPKLLLSTTGDEEMIKILEEESVYVNDLGIGLYKDLFPEYFKRRETFVKALRDINSEELRIGAAVELREIAVDFRELYFGRRNDIESILKEESKYVKQFGISVYKELFPEYFEKNQFFSDAIFSIVEDYLNVRSSKNGAENLIFNGNGFAGMSDKGREIETFFKDRSKRYSVRTVNNKSVLLKRCMLKKYPFRTLERSVKLGTITEQDIMAFAFDARYEPYKKPEFKSPEEFITQAIWAGCFKNLSSHFLPKTLGLSPEEVAVLNGRNPGRLEALKESLFKKFNLGHMVYDEIRDVIDHAIIEKAILRLFRKRRPNSLLLAERYVDAYNRGSYKKLDVSVWETMDKESLGLAVKTKREKKKMDLLEAARLCDVEKVILENIENGQKKVTVKAHVIERCMFYLGLMPEHIHALAEEIEQKKAALVKQALDLVEQAI